MFLNTNTVTHSLLLLACSLCAAAPGGNEWFAKANELLNFSRRCVFSSFPLPCARPLCMVLVGIIIEKKKSSHAVNLWLEQEKEQLFCSISVLSLTHFPPPIFPAQRLCLESGILYLPATGGLLSVSKWWTRCSVMLQSSSLEGKLLFLSPSTLWLLVPEINLSMSWTGCVGFCMILAE